MKRSAVALLVGLLIFLMVGAVAAHEPLQQYNGSIRGTVYLDQNGDGVCVGTGEPTHPGVPIEFVSNDGNWTTYLQTGDDGTYGLVAAAYGTWQVSARPNANDFAVTSTPTLSVFISESEPTSLGNDFCILPLDGSATGGTGTGGGIASFTPNTSTAPANTLLPESGASADMTLLSVILGFGMLLVASGAGLEWFRRR